MAHDVFISYSSKDKPIADAICAHLEAAGIRCWIAPRDIEAGEDWPTAIARAISESQALVLVFSAHSNSSEEVGRELFLAANHKLVIIPFKIDDVEPEPGKQYYLARTHWLDALNPPTREQIQSLVDCVKTLVPIKGSPIPTDQAPGRNYPVTSVVPAGSGIRDSKKRGSRIWIWLVSIGIAMIAMITVVGLLGFAAYTLFWNRPASTTQLTQTPASTATLPATIVPGLSPTVPPVATVTASVNTGNFTKVYLSEPFNDNSLEWSVGDVVGPWWLGARTIENGRLNWDGTSEQGMYSHVGPGAADKQDSLSDVQVSARVNLVNPTMDGSYGLFIRGSSDESTFYNYIISQGQFLFEVLRKDGTWKTVIDWRTSPYLTSSGWNTMMIQAVGKHFRLFFNDHLLAEVDDDSLSSGLSGVVISAFDANAKIQVQFDDFEVLIPNQ